MTLGNGTSGKSDVYIISLNEEGSNYVLNYYDVKENKTFLWEVKAENAVKVNISKSPETEKAGMVLLKVTSVEGIFGINMPVTNEEEGNKAVEQLLTQLSQMSEKDKKELVKQLHILSYNKFENTNLSNFEDLLQYLSEQKDEDGNPLISEPTEKAYWEKMGGNPTDDNIMNTIISIFFNAATGKISTYEITNPAGEISDSYIATENGTYTFTVKDLLTGNEYKKSLEISNIDKEQQELQKLQAMKIKVNTGEDGKVILPIPVGQECLIDWGDGNITNHEKYNYIGKKETKLASTKSIRVAEDEAAKRCISHQYKDGNINTEKIVTIIGNIKIITSDNCDETDTYYENNQDKILEIIKWGNSEIESIRLARFVNLSYIAKIPRSTKELYMGGCINLREIYIPSEVKELGPWLNPFEGWGVNQTINFEVTEPQSSWSSKWNNSCNAKINWGVNM